MREFSNLEDAKQWAIRHSGGRSVKVIVGQHVYWLQVKDPIADLRRILTRQERETRIWRALGWATVAAWALLLLGVLMH